jgi:hypothetical protein
MNEAIPILAKATLVLALAGLAAACLTRAAASLAWAWTAGALLVATRLGSSYLRARLAAAS